jgi:hypothetical protein
LNKTGKQGTYENYGYCSQLLNELDLRTWMREVVVTFDTDEECEDPSLISKLNIDVVRCCPSFR